MSAGARKSGARRGGVRRGAERSRVAQFRILEHARLVQVDERAVVVRHQALLIRHEDVGLRGIERLLLAGRLLKGDAGAALSKKRAGISAGVRRRARADIVLWRRVIAHPSCWTFVTTACTNGSLAFLSPRSQTSTPSFMALGFTIFAV